MHNLCEMYSVSDSYDAAQVRADRARFQSDVGTEASDDDETVDDVTLIKANRKIERQIAVFRSRKDNPGNFYVEAVAAVANGEFQGIQLLHAGKQEREINCKQCYQGLVDSMTTRLMSADDKKFSDLSEWVSSFLTAHQHNIGYAVPYY